MAKPAFLEPKEVKRACNYDALARCGVRVLWSVNPLLLQPQALALTLMLGLVL